MLSEGLWHPNFYNSSYSWTKILLEARETAAARALHHWGGLGPRGGGGFLSSLLLFSVMFSSVQFTQNNAFQLRPECGADLSFTKELPPQENSLSNPLV